MKTKLSVNWNSVLKRYGIGSTVSGADEIAAWLSDDLAAGSRSIDHWIEIFRAVLSGERKAGYLGSGNAHHVRATERHVFLECIFVDEMKVMMTLEQSMSVLESYRSFVSADLNELGTTPEGFWVEYEKSGQEALNCYLSTGFALGINVVD